MSQFQGSAKRSSSGTLDVYTVLALTGVFSLVVLAVTLWMAGGDLASTNDRQTEMPWNLVSN